MSCEGGGFSVSGDGAPDQVMTLVLGFAMSVMRDEAVTGLDRYLHVPAA
ncbi:hypothetical protein [Paracoccus aerodenitrificans]|nr:hypothetical protein [Paracoccus aerodenitrificans]WBU62857.1 hypothetical protein PAE61_10805 [Paracoccus aerodenitrificans]